ncbi:MAG: alanine racemase [Acidimicrobiia bacterium]
MSEYRPTRVEIDLDAIRHNVGRLRELVDPATVMAVVKADAYGHGAVPVARAVLDAGAGALGVALVEEAVGLRDAGIDAPILVLSEPVPEAAAEVVARRVTPVVYTEAGVDALAKAVADQGTEPLGVHVKVDTGMHRVGARPEDVPALVQRIVDHRELRLTGLCTHFAVADEPDRGDTVDQLDRFVAVRDALVRRGIDPGAVHAANSAGAIGFPAARLDLVRVGIALYGVTPAPGIGSDLGLRPAMALRSRVSHVKGLRAGDRVSYGLRYELPADARIATVPIGYADGVPRNLGATGGEVVVRGRRCRIAGTVTMDQLMVDVGDLSVEVGDTVTLLGGDGAEAVTAEEWADRLGTIAYEVVCGIGPRVPRSYA